MEGFPLDNILAAIDAEISRLQQVRDLLSMGGSVSSGSGKKKTTKRKLSAAARAKISAAQKKRWAAGKRRW
jgi:hypothetical protein